MTILNRPASYTLAELQEHIAFAVGGFDPSEITVEFDAMGDLEHNNARLPTLKLTNIVAENHRRTVLTIIPQGIDTMGFPERTPSRRCFNNEEDPQ